MHPMGLDVDEPTFRFLAELGRLTLFLDAFDEVKDSQRTALIDELQAHSEGSANSFRIIISARPRSDIVSSPVGPRLRPSSA